MHSWLTAGLSSAAEEVWKYLRDGFFVDRVGAVHEVLRQFNVNSVCLHVLFSFLGLPGSISLLSGFSSKSAQGLYFFRSNK